MVAGLPRPYGPNTCELHEAKSLVMNNLCEGANLSVNLLLRMNSCSDRDSGHLCGQTHTSNKPHTPGMSDDGSTLPSTIFEE